MHLDIQKNNKEVKTPKLEHKYEKIKKFLNNPITKFSLGTVGGLTGIGVLSLIAKLIYDKINKNNSIKLDVNDEKYIEKNFFLCAWENNSCWNDVFIQFLMCPEIICKEYDSEKITNTINWINTKLNEKYNGHYLNKKLKVPKKIRPVPDGLENWLDDGQAHANLVGQAGERDKYNNLCFFDMGILDQFGEAVGLDFKEETFLPFVTGKKVNNYLLEILGNSGPINKIFSPKSKDYYPTFMVIYDNIHYKNPAHVVASYIIYDKNKEIKYFLWTDGLKENMQVLSKNQGLQRLQKYNRLWVKYSTGNIVEKYYTPELMKNAD